MDNFKGSFNIQSAPFLRFRTVFRAALCQIGLFKHILCCRVLICVSQLGVFLSAYVLRAKYTCVYESLLMFFCFLFLFIYRHTFKELSTHACTSVVVVRWIACTAWCIHGAFFHLLWRTFCFGKQWIGKITQAGSVRLLISITKECQISQHKSSGLRFFAKASNGKSFEQQRRFDRFSIITQLFFSNLLV